MSSNKDTYSSKRELIRLLTNELVVKIFTTLTTEPMNTRRLSRILGVDETIVSRKLKAMERAGLVESRWVRLKDKNVKIYYPKITEYTISVSPQGVQIRFEGEDIDIQSSPIKPDDSSFFIGREEELDFLRDESKRFIYVVGLPGIGKTSLVSRYASSSGYNAVWVDILETTTLHGIVKTITSQVSEEFRKELLNALKNNHGNHNILVRAVSDLVSKHKFLLIIDNYHLNTDPAVEVLVKELSMMDNLKGKVIIISRSKPKFYLLSRKILYVKQLKREESIKLLKHYGVNMDLADKIYSIIGGHPLLLIIIAQEYRRKPDIIDRLRSEKRNYIIYEILKDLSYDDRHILNLLCVLRKAAPYKLIKGLDINSKLLRKRLEKMSSDLIIVRLPTGYQISELIRDYYCRDLMDPETYHYIAATYYARSNDYEDLVEALYHYTKAGRCRDSLPILKKVADLVLDHELIITPFQRILMEMRDNTTDQLVKAWILLTDSKFKILSGKLKEAFDLLNWVETVGFEKTDYKLYTYAKIEKSVIYRYMGRYRDALNELKRAKKVIDNAKVQDKIDLKAKVYLALAPLYYFDGKVENALRILEKLLSKYLDPEDNFRRAIAVGWMGLVYRLMYEPGKSIEKLNEAIELFKKEDSKNSLAIAYKEIALSYLISKDIDKAMEYLDLAIKTFREINDQKHLIPLIIAYLDYAIIKLLINDIDGAMKYIREIDGIVGENGLVIPQNILFYDIALTLLHYRRGETSKALERVGSIIDKLNETDYFRKIYALTIITPVICSICGECRYCDILKEKIDEILSSISRSSFNISNHRRSMEHIANLLIGKAF